MHAKLKLARLGTFLNSPTWRVLVYYRARFGLQEKICYGEFRCTWARFGVYMARYGDFSVLYVFV